MIMVNRQPLDLTVASCCLRLTADRAAIVLLFFLGMIPLNRHTVLQQLKPQLPIRIVQPKIARVSSAQSGARGGPAKIEGHSILGSGKILRPPSVKERIERLMRLASELEHEADVSNGASEAS